MHTYTQEEAASIVGKLSQAMGDICRVNKIDYTGMNSADAEGMAIGDVPSDRRIVIVYLGNERSLKRFNTAMERDKGFAALRPLGLVPMVGRSRQQPLIDS